jgi:hypothetical protein
MTPCFECGRPAAEDHHVVPESLGGTKTVPLCADCHAKVHALDGVLRTALPALQAAGIARAKAAGRYGGRKGGRGEVDPHQAGALKAMGYSEAEIAESLGVTARTVRRYLREDAA